MSQISAADLTAPTQVGNAGLTVSPKMLNTITTPNAPKAPVEATPPAQAEQTATPTIDPKVAEMMARREKAFYAKQREEAARLKSEREAFQREQEFHRAELDKYKSWKSKIENKQYLDLFQENGVSYEALTEQVLNAPSAEQRKIIELEQKLAALEGKQQEVLSASEQQDKDRIEAAKKQITYDVQDLVAKNPDDFELISKMKVFDSVTEVIERVYNEEGRIINLYEAAKEVEDYLLERMREYASVKKLQATPVEAAPAAETQKTSPTSQTQTLSNRMVPSGAKPLTAKERRERAILAAMGQLPK